MLPFPIILFFLRDIIVKIKIEKFQFTKEHYMMTLFDSDLLRILF